MKIIDLLALFVLLSVAGCSPFVSSAKVEPPAPPCGKQHPLQVISLAHFPDPLPAARRIDQWRAVIRSDSAETCATRLQIVEKPSDNPSSIAYIVHLSSGTNEVLMNSIEQFRLDGSEVCFQAIAEIDGVRGPLPGPPRACTKSIDKGLWSMR